MNGKLYVLVEQGGVVRLLCLDPKNLDMLHLAVKDIRNDQDTIRETASGVARAAPK